MTVGKIVRTSKFRHVFGTGSKKESCYDGAHVSLDSNDWHLVKANAKFLSIHWDSAGGGAFLVHPLSATGRLPTAPPLYTGHTGPVLDTDWHPFNDHVIASAGEDGRILLWNVPDEAKGSGPPPEDGRIHLHAGELRGHERRIVDLAWNPTVESLLASASHDMSVRIWDVQGAACRLTLEGHCDAVLDQSWALAGDLLATSCRDKAVRIFDPRAGPRPTLQRDGAHAGVKGIRVAWVQAGGSEQVLTTGFGRASEREVALWDPRRMEQATTTLTVDSASGPLLPFYDSDCRMLYLAGRGDGNIRYYEMIGEAPYLYALSEYKSSDPQRGLALLPKRAVNVAENEIARFIKVYGSQAILEPISFKVPRRESIHGNGAAGSAAFFAADIYPETLAPEATMDVREYFEGVSRPPRRMSLEPSAVSMLATRATGISLPAVAEDAAPKHEAPQGEEQLREALKALQKENEQLKGDLNQKTVRIRQLESLLQGK